MEIENCCIHISKMDVHVHPLKNRRETWRCCRWCTRGGRRNRRWEGSHSCKSFHQGGQLHCFGRVGLTLSFPLTVCLTISCHLLLPFLPLLLQDLLPLPEHEPVPLLHLLLDHPVNNKLSTIKSSLKLSSMMSKPSSSPASSSL